MKQQHEWRIRTIPVDYDSVSLLSDYVKRGGPVNRNGKLMLFGFNRHRAWQILTECAERAGLPRLVNPETGKVHGVSPHRLRDAFAVHAVKQDDSGDGLRMLQQHLGHSDINVTLRYRKIASEEHRLWYNQLWKEGDKD